MALLALALVAGCDNRKADDEAGAADGDRTGPTP